MDQSTHDVRLSNWKSIVEACQASGVSNRQWCDKHNVNIKQYYNWQRKVRNAIVSGMKNETSIVPIPTSLLSNITSVETHHSQSIVFRSGNYQPQPDAILHIHGATIELQNTVLECQH